MRQRQFATLSTTGSRKANAAGGATALRRIGFRMRTDLAASAAAAGRRRAVCSGVLPDEQTSAGNRPRPAIAVGARNTDRIAAAAAGRVHWRRTECKSLINEHRQLETERLNQDLIALRLKLPLIVLCQTLAGYAETALTSYRLC